MITQEKIRLGQKRMRFTAKTHWARLQRMASSSNRSYQFASPASIDEFSGKSALFSPTITFPERTNTTSAWDGSISQEELMQKDQCITVDEKDCILGSGSKYDVHRFHAQQPQGILHRAFSVFLFDSQNRLLLQQRAASKITFPNVWTNTCCSHPIVGQNPEEIDATKSVLQGNAEGAKAAAIRKLDHELGIAKGSLVKSDFKFLTRLHYCAPDSVTYGPKAEWGEHEMDYILLAKKNVSLCPNPEEVQDVKYVTEAELKEMMSESNGLLWSPWFRIIVSKFLGRWWKDLDKTLTSDSLCDWQSIHKIMNP